MLNKSSGLWAKKADEFVARARAESATGFLLKSTRKHKNQSKIQNKLSQIKHRDILWKTEGNLAPQAPQQFHRVTYQIITTTKNRNPQTNPQIPSNELADFFARPSSVEHLRGLNQRYLTQSHTKKRVLGLLGALEKRPTPTRPWEKYFALSTATTTHQVRGLTVVDKEGKTWGLRGLISLKTGLWVAGLEGHRNCYKVI